jgi:hypothetical protein
MKINKITIFPIDLYGCETLSRTLREECRQNIFDNRMLTRIFGSTRDEMVGGWRKLHNKELHDLCSWSIIIRMIKSRRMRWAVHVAGVGENMNAYRILVGRLRRPRLGGRIILRWIVEE